MQGRLLSLAWVAAAVAGCADAPPAPPLAVAASADAGKRFDPAHAGTITGAVSWRGEAPVVPPMRSTPEPFTDRPAAEVPPARDWPNPNAPAIDPASRALASAVVFLRRVDPGRSRPWDHPPALVELRDQRVHVRQGASDRNVGFVRAGDAVDLVSRDGRFHALQGRGASFFARTLPGPDEVRTRRLSAPGVVELRSGAGYFWMRGYLLVDHHPYYAHADARGRFTLDNVPAGEYDLVAWHPDWRVTREYRNPDSFRVQQVTFREALQGSRRVVVEARKTTEVRLELPGR